ncbi:MAG: DUF11 domain-containing protein [Hymenobacteraceae bacterium]|nr:DUF11 domain-containing protein [Hymenobacteraceae bacterium]
MRVFFRFCFLLGALLVPMLRGTAQRVAAQFGWIRPAYNTTLGGSRSAVWGGGTTDALGNTYSWVNYRGAFTLDTLTLTPPDSLSRIGLVKLTPTGRLAWYKDFGLDSARVGVGALTTDAAGNLYLVGRLFRRQLWLDGTLLDASSTAAQFLAKWSPVGTLQFARLTGTAVDQSPTHLRVDHAGAIYVAGSYQGYLDLGTCRLDNPNPGSPIGTGWRRPVAYVAKLSATGVADWVRGLSAPDSLSISFGAGLGIDAAGEIYFCGEYGGGAALGGAVLPAGPNPANRLRVDRLFWSRLSPTGQLRRVQTMRWPSPVGGSGGGGVDFIVNPTSGFSYGMVTLTDSATLVPGLTRRSGGRSDALLFCLDPNGNFQWTQQFGGTTTADVTYPYSLALSAGDQLLVTGVYTGRLAVDGQAVAPVFAPGPYPQRLWVSSLEAKSGRHRWTLDGRASQGIYMTQVCAGPAGARLAVQSFGDTVQLGNQQFAMPGNRAFKLFTAQIVEQYNTLTGAAYLDANANNQQDATEGGFPGGLVVEVNPGNVPCAAPESTGRYDAYVDLDVNYAASLPNPPPYYTVVAQGPPTATFSTYGNVAAGRSFALQPIANRRDVEVILTLISPARPGNLLNYQVQYRNVGTVAITGGTVVLLPDARLVWQSSSVPGVSGAGGAQTWVYAGLQPGETRRLNVVYRLPATAVLGTIVSATATITPLAGDLDLTNNSSVAERTVTGSYDPNDIQVNHVRLSTTQVAAGEWLEYTIRFQNHGTDTAFTVRLTDSLPAARLRLATLQVLAASHNCVWGLSPQGELTVQFPSIMLPAQLTNQLASDGFVRFRVRPATALVAGDEIPNQAQIYFDYNLPMATNTVLTAVAAPTGFGAEAGSPTTALVWPNPTSGALHVEAPRETAGTLTLTLLDALGRAVRTESVAVAAPGRARALLDVRGLPAGLYVLRGTGAGPGFARRVVVR